MGFKLFLLAGLVLILSTSNAVFADECTDAGHSCEWHSCAMYQERVYELECSQEPQSGMICCKEIINEGVTPSLTVSPQVVEDMDIIAMSAELPRFMACDTWITSPSGTKKYEGHGGCGPSGEFQSFSTIRLEDLFTVVEPGLYVVDVLATHDEESDIELTSQFYYNAPKASLTTDCSVEDRADVCSIAGKDYLIETSGCYSDLDITITYDEGKDSFTGVDVGDAMDLKDGTEVKLTGAPCSVAIINFRLTVELDTKCGDGACEVGEDASNCEADCGSGDVFADTLSDDVALQDGEEVRSGCSIGCLYGNSCVNVGVRTETTYCNLNGEFFGQKQNKESCNNDYECRSGICSGGTCKECIDTGSRVENKYCDGSGEYAYQKASKEACSNDYECQSETCHEGTCKDCVTPGERTENTYCDEFGEYFPFKENKMECGNDYECSSEYCTKGVCKDRGVVVRFFDFFRNLFRRG